MAQDNKTILFIASLLTAVFFLSPFIVSAGHSGFDSAALPCQWLDAFIRHIGTVMQAIIGSITIIMIMVAAFKYTTAGDDAAKVKSAHATITWAVIGLAVTLLATVVPGIVSQLVGGALACPA